MTHKTETALDLDGLAASGFTEGPWWVATGSSWRRIRSHYTSGQDVEVISPCRASDGHPDLTCQGGEDLASNLTLAAAAPSLLSLALTQRDQIAAKDARIRELEDVLQYLDISDKDASLIRGLLDVTDIWDNHDKAIDRMLSCFPNDPLNIKLASPNQSKRKDG